MGACNSSAALDPADVTGDGSAPVFWSPERDQEKRAAKLREIQQQQQAEIERATGHLKKGTAGRRSTMSKSRDEEKQQADDSTVVKPNDVVVQPARPSRTARPTSASLSSPVQRPVLSEEELSEYPVPRSARRHARATSGSVPSVASPTRSPEVSVSAGTRGESETLASPRQQTSTEARRASTVPEAVKEEGRYMDDDKKEVVTPVMSNTPAVPSTTSATATTITAVRVVALPGTQRVEKAEAVEKVTMSSASAAFGVQLKRVAKTVESPVVRTETVAASP